jgi:hypothetical protein
MNISSICLAVLVPFLLVMPCQGQQPPQNDVQLREAVERLQVENIELKLEQKQLKAQLAALMQSEREAIAAMASFHEVKASQREVLEIQKSLLAEVRQLKQGMQRIFETVQGKKPLPKPLQQGKRTREPNDPFAQPARSNSPK